MRSMLQCTLRTFPHCLTLEKVVAHALPVIAGLMSPQATRTIGPWYMTYSV
jgi:hypothetical protein